MSFKGKITTIIYRGYCACQAKIINNGFNILKKYEVPMDFQETQLSPLTDFEYKCENWEPIHYLQDVLIASAKHKTLKLNNNDCFLSEKGKVKGNSIIIHTGKQSNNWICFIYRHTLKNNYIFEFDIVIRSEFKEIQVAFKFRDLANRLRFMVRDNREAVFEVIKDGRFYKHIFVKPYSLKHDLQYHFKVIVDNNRFGFYVNNEVVFLIIQKMKIESLGNGLCLILYNDSDSNEINCEISNIKISYD